MPRHAVWRDVEDRAVQIGGTPDPAYPDPYPCGCGFTPTGTCTMRCGRPG